MSEMDQELHRIEAVIGRPIPTGKYALCELTVEVAAEAEAVKRQLGVLPAILFLREVTGASLRDLKSHAVDAGWQFGAD